MAPTCRARRVSEPVSLVDLLPTLMDIAGESRGFRPAVPLDGRSLLPAAACRPPAPGVVHAEYMAEGTDQPMFMIRRGPFKYIGAQGDPPLLFDLSSDPAERRNLAGSRPTAKIERGFAAEVASKWDAEALRGRILESQRGRRAVHAALTTGQLAPWDFRPPPDPAGAYYRNDGSPDPERPLRFPPSKAPSPKRPPSP